MVEVILPDDETWAKFSRHHVDEICTADPIARELRWFALDPTAPAYEETDTSALLDLSVADLVPQIDWPR